MMCQVCGAAGVKENIQPEVPWDLYIVIAVMAIAAIGDCFAALREPASRAPTSFEDTS